MSLSTSAARHVVFLLENMQPSKKDNVQIFEPRAEDQSNIRMRPSYWARGPPAEAR